ncbi:MAG: APC family permease [Tissierellia bacterium]|nr:APC family permease [Tissierellia bacterium]
MEERLSKFGVFSLVVGSIIGWGSFTLPGTSFLNSSGVVNTTIGLIIGGLLVIAIQYGYKIMLREHISEGGEFSYTYENLGERHGFIVGWSLILCYLSLVPLNALAYVLLFRKIFGPSISQVFLYNFAGYDVFLSDIALASFVIILFAWINIRGLKLSSRIQNFMSVALVIVVFALFFYMAFAMDSVSFKDNYLSNYNFSFKDISLVVAIVPFLFVGFDVVPQVSTELNFKPEKADRVTIIAIVFGVLLYAMLNSIAAFNFSPVEAVADEWAVGSSVIKSTGMFGFSFLVVALWAAVTGGINGFMISSSRLLGALSRYGMAPESLGKKNLKGIYSNAIVFITGISLIGPWIGREVIIYIVDMSSLLAAIVYTYVAGISFGKAKSKLEKNMSNIARLSGLLFISLLVLPFSPSRLSTNSFVFLVVWITLGLIFYTGKKNVKNLGGLS